MAPIEQLVAFFGCVRAGKHDFSKSDICENCRSRKDDPTLLDVIRHAKAKKENPYAQ